MTLREEILHLSSEELNEVYDSLVKCLAILNPENESLIELSSNGKDMTFQIRLAKTAILSRILELDK